MISALAKVFIVFMIILSFAAGTALGGFGVWYKFAGPEIKRLTEEKEKFGEELDKARIESRNLVKREFARERDADEARQANVEALRDCVYPDDLRMRLEALAKATRDDSRYEERKD